MKNRYVIKLTALVFLVFMCYSQDPNTGAGDPVPEGNSGEPREPVKGFERDFYFPNMDVRSAFKAVAAAGQIDIVLSPNVAGRVNLTLTGKTWRQAMEVLCQMFTLQYTVEDEYIYVQTLKDYNASVKEAQLVREIINIKHTKVTDLQSAVTGLLSERGKMTVVEKSNAFIISDIEPKLYDIKRAIATLDVEIYQVHIQAQILEISSDAAMELGINWSAGTGDLSQSEIQVAPDNIPSATTGDAVLGKSSPGRVASSTLSLGFQLLDGQLGAVIEHLLSEGKGEVVAKPQITTLDNTQARIFIGEKRPYLKLDQNLNSTTEFVDAGIELVVTPHITNDNRVIIDLQPQRSEARTDAVTRGPIVTTTEAKTTVVVNDGETVVIGGLTSKVENTTERGIPFLKDIPLLGILFKYTSSSTVKKDLVIFITPYIVKKGMNVASTISRKAGKGGSLFTSGGDLPEQTEDDGVRDEDVEGLLDDIGN